MANLCRKHCSSEEDGPTIPYAKLALLEGGRVKIKSSEEARSKLISWTKSDYKCSSCRRRQRRQTKSLKFGEGRKRGEQPDGCDDVGTQGEGPRREAWEGGHFHPSVRTSFRYSWNGSPADGPPLLWPAPERTVLGPEIMLC